MTWLEVIAGILIFIVVLIIIFILDDVHELLKEKKKKTKAETILLLKDESRLQPNIEMTNALLDFIIYMIDSEIAQRISFLTFMRSRYNIQNLDHDVQEIGQRVFNSLKKEVLLNKDLVVNDDYILQFIMTETTLHVTASMTQHNITITPVIDTTPGE